MYAMPGLNPRWRRRMNPALVAGILFMVGSICFVVGMAINLWLMLR